MRQLQICVLTAAMAAILGSAAAAEQPTRRFTFTYAGTITDLKPGANARIWLPMPQPTAHQKVRRGKTELGARIQITREPKYGNAMIYYEAVADAKGRIPFSVEYDVTRVAAHPNNAERAPKQLEPFLQANSRVPVVGVVSRLFGEKPKGKGLVLARKIYNQVDHHMRYDKPEGGGWGLGDTHFACDAGFGNCTDFHSLYISLCRELDLPARFEIGFPIPPGKGGEVGGYHCWAAAAIDGRWAPVDISEADKHPEKRDFYFGNLDAGRVQFTKGRDIALRPANASGPLNFFVYPHVEVDGKQQGRLEKAFRWREIDN